LKSRLEFFLDIHIPGIEELPWDTPIEDWVKSYNNVHEAPKGLSRHSVIYVTINNELFVLKESTANLVENEFRNLKRINELRIPVVTTAGYIIKTGDIRSDGILLTQYLEHSLPYRLLFQQVSLKRYKENLLDAMASLLVQLHLLGVFWGDCSLSNTLFRRDAGALQAYLVDAETVEIKNQKLAPELRSQELDLMEENIRIDLQDVNLNLLTDGIPVSQISDYVRLRYQQIWEEITKEERIQKGDQYPIQERVRALNRLGFSVGGIDLTDTINGSQLNLRVIVTDRNYHRDQLHSLTGLEALENQAQKILNEILELRATLSAVQNRAIPLTVAAYHWYEDLFKPTVEKLRMTSSMIDDPIELYCQVLEHKWFLSEFERRDVGHQFATDNYIKYITNTVLKQKQ
jgi:hypothetical protein